MSPTTALIFGTLIGLFVSAVVVLTTLGHYVAQDMDGFRKWLDTRET